MGFSGYILSGGSWGVWPTPSPTVSRSALLHPLRGSLGDQPKILSADVFSLHIRFLISSFSLLQLKTPNVLQLAGGSALSKHRWKKRILALPLVPAPRLACAY